MSPSSRRLSIVGRKLSYRPGSYYVTDDRTGFPQRAESTRKEWNGLRVDGKVWEPRQPQDLVKGVPDIQAVPDPRPLGANIFVSAIYLQITANMPVGAFVIPVASLAYVTVGDTVAVIICDGSLYMTFITGILPAISSVVIDPSRPLPLGVPNGNEIVDYRIPHSGAFPQYLATEDGTPITTEDGKAILVT